MNDIVIWIIVGILLLVLIWFATRELRCWYWKINARLHEQRKTNELLQNIYDALVQGNSLGAMQVGTTESLRAQIAKGGKKMEEALAGGQNAAAQNTVQIPQSGEIDDSLPSL